MQYPPAALLVALALPLAACTAPAGDAPDPASTAEVVDTPARAAGTPETATPASSPTPTAGAAATASPEEGGDDRCGARKVAPWIGREATVPVRSEVAKAASAQTDRWIYPDSVVTMDFNPTRLNVIMEKGTDRIVSARCG